MILKKCLDVFNMKPWHCQTHQGATEESLYPRGRVFFLLGDSRRVGGADTGEEEKHSWFSCCLLKLMRNHEQIIIVPIQTIQNHPPEWIRKLMDLNMEMKK